MIKQREKQKELEYIKIKEWEEKFDREQKIKEQRENLREQKLREKELERLKSFENAKPIDEKLSSGLENLKLINLKRIKIIIKFLFYLQY